MKSCCEGKNIDNCGKCMNFPCETLKRFAYDKKQGNNGERIEQCCPDEKFLGDDMFVKTVSLSEQKQLKNHITNY